MTATVHISEALYVDPRAGNDKFYRSFAFGNRWVAQYGRNGTLGTFTKVVEAADPEAAMKAAAAKLASKIKKGYAPSKSGAVNGVVVADDLTVLDRAADALPDGQHADQGEQAAPFPTFVAAEELPARPDLAAQVIADLTDHGVSAAAAVAADLAPSLPVRPMLASVQPEPEVTAALGSDRWVAQYKYDGDRVVVEVRAGQIQVLNRQGLPKVRNVGHAQLLPFTALHTGRWVFDGEIVGRTLVLFDLVAASANGSTWVGEQSAFTDRHRALRVVADVLGVPAVADAAADAPVVLAPLATTADEKADFLADAITGQREGIILRHSHGTYEQGRRSTTLVKHKLVKDADLIVTALHPSKQSASLAVYDDAGQLVEVGSASTIGKDALAGIGGVQVGQVWTATFLYVTDPAHPRMVQPRLIARRDDKGAAECLLGQFADAGTNKIV